MSKIAVVYHSGFGHTKALADSVAAGVGRVPGAEAVLIPAADAETRAAELDAADAIVFGSPTYMGNISAEFAKFSEWSSKRWMSRAWQNKLAAGFTNSASWSGDKQNTLVQLMTLAMQHGMVWVGLGLAPGFNHSKGSIEDLNRLGASIGAMAQSNADQGIEGTQASRLPDHGSARPARRRSGAPVEAKRRRWLRACLRADLDAGPLLEDLRDEGEVGVGAEPRLGDGEHLAHRRAHHHGHAHASRLVEAEADVLVATAPWRSRSRRCRGRMARGNLSWLALLRPLEALMMSIRTLASSPAFTPIAIASDVATSAVAASRLLASLAVWARPGFSPVWKSLPKVFRIGSSVR